MPPWFSRSPCTSPRTPWVCSRIGPGTGRLSIPLIRPRSGTGYSCATEQTAATRPPPAVSSGTGRVVGALMVSPPARCVSRARRMSLLLRVLAVAAAVGREGGDEGLLRNLDGTDVLHALLALLLLLQELALAGDVTPVALGEHILANRADVLAGDDARADRGLDRHLELLARDQILELAGHLDAV